MVFLDGYIKVSKEAKTGNKRNKNEEYVTGSKEIKDSKEAKPVTKETKPQSMLPAQRKLRIQKKQNR